MSRTEHPIRKRYQNRIGNSGVECYAYGASFIDIWFKDGRRYRYDVTRPGAAHVQAMKRLAEDGEGLATYINQHVRGNYARKFS